MKDENIEYPELPNGWLWASGESSSSYYTRWFRTEYMRGGDLVGVCDSLGGFDGEVYWDEGEDHTVVIYPVIGVNEAGDPQTGYPAVSMNYDTMEEAINAVPDLIRELKGD